MYGNTHVVADAIGDGLRDGGEVSVVSIHDAGPEVLADADLLVVGGPTHVHGMTGPMSRKAALEAAAKPGSDLDVDPDAEGPGLREWFDSLEQLSCRAAAFDTRIDAPSVVTGRASKGIARRLRHHGCSLIAEPESFLVDKQSHLEADEQERARAWGAALASSLSAVVDGVGG